MRFSAAPAILTTAVPILLMAAATAAEAKCHRFAFAVNDFGQEGPSDDAKELLDQYIAEWAADRGIKKYTVGKKHVACELFLNLIVFDEHTCTAAADVCWSGQGKWRTPAALPMARAGPHVSKAVAAPTVVPLGSKLSVPAEAEKSR
jgi:hypothetical protein